MNRDIINAIVDGKELIAVILIVISYQLLSMSVYVSDTLITMCVLNRQFVRITAELNKAVYKKALETNYSNLDDPDFYDCYSWTVKEYAGQSDAAMELIKKVLVSLFSITTLLTVLFKVSGDLFVLIVTIVYLVIVIPIDKSLSKLNIEKRTEMHKHNRKLDYIQRIFYLKDFAETLKITLMPLHLLSWHKNVVSEKMKAQKDYNLKISIITVLQVAVQHICTIAVMCFYILQIYDNKIGIGDFVATVSAAALLRKTFYNFTTHYKNYNDISMSASKIRVFFNSPSEYSNPDETEIKTLSEGPFSVVLKNVSFLYPGTNVGINDISISIKAGSKIAIVGSNGAGKTTLVKLLLGLYKPDKGEILINGHPLDKYDISSYRLSVGVALQSTSIFALSIRDNLSRYDNMNDETIDEVLSDLKLEKIKDLSKGDYSTPFLRDFDKEGIELSGGERQKIALGALLSRKFPLLILDEPTSSLDPIAEFELGQLIADKSSESTTIVISHRLSAIKDSDYIIVMDHGRIVEAGTHDELYKNKALYFDMFEKQSRMYN